MKGATVAAIKPPEANEKGFIESDSDYHYNDPAITTASENATF